MGSKGFEADHALEYIIYHCKVNKRWTSSRGVNITTMG